MLYTLLEIFFSSIIGRTYAACHSRVYYR